MPLNPRVLDLSGATVFVTGGSGFVGRNLIAALRDRGATVRALARSDHSAAAVEAAGAHTAVRGDLLDSEALREGMQGCQAVFHAAAWVKDYGRYDEVHEINVGGTRAVLDAALQARVQRLVHVGTEAALVGGGPIVAADERRPLPRRAVGVYPQTKKLAEEAVRDANSERLETVVIRPRFIWGAGDTSLLPQLVEAVRAGKFAWIGGGHHLTSTCHVANVVEGALLAAERGAPGGVYFLTDGEPVSFREFLTAMLGAVGVDAGDKSVPRVLALTAGWVVDAVWSLLRLRARPPLTLSAVKLFGEEVTVSDARARQELGYRAATSREAGLQELRRHPAGG